MATRTNRVEVEITATDEASPKIERLERKIDGLESDEARIIVTAQTDRLEQQLSTAKQKLDGLDGDEASVQLRAVDNLTADVEQARQLLSRLDGQTGTVHIAATDTASGDIDRVRRELHDLDGEAARVRTSATGSIRSTAGGVAAGIGVAGIAAALFDSVQEANNLALEVQTLADATGAPLEQAARLLNVWKSNGLELGDLLDIIGQVNQTLTATPDLAKQLGVNIAGNQSLIDTFLQSVQGVGTAYQDVADRQVAASTLFGEEGVRQIGAVTTSVGDLQTAMDKLPEAQLTDAGDVQRFRDANAELVEFKGKLTEIQITLAEGLLPLVTAIADSIAAWFDGAKRLGEWTQEHPRLNTFLFDPNPLHELGAVFGGQNTTTGPFPPGQRGQGVFPQQVTVINPPGTTQTTIDAQRIYERRNGPR